MFITSLLLFVVYTIWWLLFNFGYYLSINVPPSFGDLYADTYGITALVGALAGFIAYRVWGGFKSYLGKALAFFSLGLLGQFFGQITYTFIYRFTGVENAYPSFGEVFFASSVMFYILAAWYLAKSSGLTLSLVSVTSKIVTLAVPVIFILISYLTFLRNYDSSEFTSVEVFLDYFYPVFQAIFVSLAIATYYATRSVLGGLMRKYVLFTLLALVMQYAADSFFILRTRSGEWLPGGFSDYFFVASYFLMTLSLLGYVSASEKLRIKSDGVLMSNVEKSPNIG